MAKHFKNQASNQTSTPSRPQSFQESPYPYAPGNHYAYVPSVEHKKKKKHHGGLIALAIILVVVVACVASGLSLYHDVTVVKADASELMGQASTLKTSLKEGDAAALSSAVSTISSNTDEIDNTVHGPLWNLATHLPVYGEDVRSVQTLGSTAEDLVNNALIPITDAASGMKVSTLVSDGSINVGMLKQLSDSVTAALPTIKNGVDTINALPDAHVAQVQEVLTKVKEPLANASSMIDTVQSILPVLPQILGSEGKRTYLVLAATNAEIRPTIGLPGSWGTVTVDNGAISMGDFSSEIVHNGNLQATLTDEEKAVLGTIDPAGVVVEPDFTRVGQMASEFWSEAGYGDVDGVICIDPVFLQRLIGLTGGSATTTFGENVDGTNAAYILEHGTYVNYPTQTDLQDAYFSEVASAAFKQILHNIGNASMTDLFKTVQQAGIEGRCNVWSPDESEENAYKELGIDGSLRGDVANPVVGVYVTDDTYSKISYYLRDQSTIDSAANNADGTMTYQVTTTLSNALDPNDAASLPRYITGYHDTKLATSDMVGYVAIMAPEGGSVSNVTFTDSTTDAGVPYNDSATMGGRQYVMSAIHILGGQTSTFTYQVTTAAGAGPLSVYMNPTYSDQ